MQLRSVQDDQRQSYRSYSPGAAGPAQRITQSEFTVSPSGHKRRKHSEEEERVDPLDISVGRSHRSPARQRNSLAYSSTSIPSEGESWRTSDYSTAETWSTSHRGCPSYLTPGAVSSVHSAPHHFDSSNRNDFRPTLPSLPSLTLDHGAHNDRNHCWADYALAPESVRTGHQQHVQLNGPALTSPSNHAPSYPYGYQQQLSQSRNSPGAQERTPFAPASYRSQPYEYLHDMSHETKLRKRRGNLPKETTDKLRAWFVAHLHHPYPTEDEKQVLMRHTGLQLSKPILLKPRGSFTNSPLQTRLAIGSSTPADANSLQ